MKLLVFGERGQLARALIRRAPPGVTVTAMGRAVADLSQPQACAALVAGTDADAVINAAAWTAVDLAEAEEAAATVVNGSAPAAMAEAAARRGLPFLQVSTDYVFDGTGTAAYAPDHPTAPINAYGRSKLAGELGVRAAGGKHLILRCSWVFSGEGPNFVTAMLRLGQERERLRVVGDQIGGPTAATDLADSLIVAAGALRDGAEGGTHHFAGGPDVGRADFARAIMDEARLPCRIEAVPSSDYPTPARRPLNSRLDCRSFEAAFGVSRPDWRQGLADILRGVTA